MVLHLADELEVPLRERNGSCSPPATRRSTRSARSTSPRCSRSTTRPARARRPRPVSGDHRRPRLGARRRTTAAAGLLMEGLPDDLLAPPMNVLRASLHPDGLAPRIANLGQWKAHLLERLARQAALTGDPALRTLHAELAAYPAPEDEARGPASDVVVPLRLRIRRRRAALLQHRDDVRDAGRHHRRGAVDRVVLPAPTARRRSGCGARWARPPRPRPSCARARRPSRPPARRAAPARGSPRATSSRSAGSRPLERGRGASSSSRWIVAIQSSTDG